MRGRGGRRVEERWDGGREAGGEVGEGGAEEQEQRASEWARRAIQ